MATTMRKETRDKQYEQYLLTYQKQLNAGNVSFVEWNGKKEYDAPLPRYVFDKKLDEALAEMAPNDSKKYKLGETIFYDMSSKYTKRQISHFRKEVINNMARVFDERGKAAQELADMLTAHSYKSGGKLVVRKDYFEANLGIIMDLYFEIGGYIGKS